MMQTKQIIGLLIAVAAVVGGIAYLESGKVAPVAYSGDAKDVMATSTPGGQTAAERITDKSSKYDKAKEIVAPSGFVNTNGLPITLSQYVGKKVILLDIMTYSCINCIRTFPYLVDWYKKYEDKGLVIIGIHTPEFDFEKNIDNVKAAMEKYGIKFPVVLDNDYGTWSAYKNLYWPRKYLIDIDGFIRFDHVGEGGYDETEAKIQELLDERADVLGLGASAKSAIHGLIIPDTGVPVSAGQTPETYIGSARRNPQSGLKLVGDWDIQPEFAETKTASSSIIYPITAKHVYLVASADTATKLDVIVDGTTMAPVTVKESRLYEVYSGASFGSHTIELRPESAGFKAFAFTFGS